MRVADFTASGDLHPAPKNIPFSAKNIAQDEQNCKLFFSQIWDVYFVGAFIVREIRFFFKSTLRTLTFTISPTLNTSDGCLM
jgi:hypothetical protein